MFGGRLLPVDERTAVTAAALHIPDPMPEMDALIAATATVRDCDFQRTGVPLLNPWEPL